MQRAVGTTRRGVAGIGCREKNHGLQNQGHIKSIPTWAKTADSLEQLSSLNLAASVRKSRGVFLTKRENLWLSFSWKAIIHTCLLFTTRVSLGKAARKDQHNIIFYRARQNHPNWQSRVSSLKQSQNCYRDVLRIWQLRTQLNQIRVQFWKIDFDYLRTKWVRITKLGKSKCCGESFRKTFLGTSFLWSMVSSQSRSQVISTHLSPYSNLQLLLTLFSRATVLQSSLTGSLACFIDWIITGTSSKFFFVLLSVSIKSLRPAKFRYENRAELSVKYISQQRRAS